MRDIKIDENSVRMVEIGISNQHLHLCQEDLEVLFGEGYELTPMKPLKQPKQFASVECVQVVGTKGVLNSMRILGPVRPETQVELSQTSARQIGIKAPYRNSGDLENSESCVLVGPKGTVILEQGVICVKPHLHLNDEEGEKLGIKDKDIIDLYIEGDIKSGCLFNVLARVGEAHSMELHLDTDEANAFTIGKVAKAVVL